MKKYFVIYYAPTAWDMTGASPEEMQKGMEAWMAWAAACGDGLLDMGSPLNKGQKVTKAGASSSDKGAVGYSILQANTMDEALKMLRNHPHLDWADGCEIEVHEAPDAPSNESGS